MSDFVDIRISGIDLNLDEITSRLAMNPDYAYKKGDTCLDYKYGGTKIVYSEDCWITAYKPKEKTPVEKQLEEFVNVLADSSDYLQELASKHDVTIWISMYPDNEQVNLHISTPTIKTLARIGASLDCSTAYLKSFHDGLYDRQAGGKTDGRA